MQELYTVAETAKILRVGKNKVYDLIHAGLLPVLIIGGIKIRKATLLEFISKYEGYDLTDPMNVRKIDLNEAVEGGGD